MNLLRRTWMLWAAVAAILVGYLALAAGRLSIGPLLLVGGYCVLLPFFLYSQNPKRANEIEILGIQQEHTWSEMTQSLKRVKDSVSFVTWINSWNDKMREAGRLEFSLDSISIH